MHHAAAELYGSCCRIVAVDRDAPDAVAAHHECALDARAPRVLLNFRRAHDLGQALRVILWPDPGEPGVTPIGERPSAPVAPLSTLAIRARVGPLIRAGFKVTAVARPHQVLAELASQHGTSLAVTLALHDDGGCVAGGRDGLAGPRPGYLQWDAGWCAETAGSGDELARYQFAASLSPHVRRQVAGLKATGPRLLACGSMANLRTAMAPLSEEFGQEVQVLDHPWPGMLDSEAGTNPTEPARWQLARAAARSAAEGRIR